MDGKFTKLLLMLSTLDLTRKELNELISTLNHSDQDLLYQKIKNLQTEGRNTHKTIGFFTAKVTPPRAIAITEESETSVRVVRLLKHEAHLDARQAVELMKQKIQDLNIANKDALPPLSRKSLSNWIMRLENKIPEKEILRCATIIRNEQSPRPLGDWNLKQEG